MNPEDAVKQDIILPRKIRGTPTMYADLQFPKSSNFGSMKRGDEQKLKQKHVVQSKNDPEYARIRFFPKTSEQAEL